jgi:hypothetical protein
MMAIGKGRTTEMVLPSPGHTALAGLLDAGGPELLQVARHARMGCEDLVDAANHDDCRRPHLDRYPGVPQTHQDRQAWAFHARAGVVRMRTFQRWNAASDAPPRAAFVIGRRPK